MQSAGAARSADSRSTERLANAGEGITAARGALGLTETKRGKTLAFNWTCPHCGTPQSVVNEKYKTYVERIYLADQAEGALAVRVLGVGCSAIGCEKHTIHVALGPAFHETGKWHIVSDESYYLFNQMIYPQGASKPLPDYIPGPLREDYQEACLIRDLSPKASATLIRRCLQGMIRDFAGISKGRLIDEIGALRKAVDENDAPAGISHDSVDAIDAVRGIGNIGAHMEKDINVIVEVEPGEAQALIELTELLFEEWYVARHKRQQRLISIQEMAAAKKQALINAKGAAETGNNTPATD